MILYIYTYIRTITYFSLDIHDQKFDDNKSNKGEQKIICFT